jgi:hypothetical protein
MAVSDHLEVAKALHPDAIIATGRSDYPNQVNNVVCIENLNPDVTMMKSAEYRAWNDDSNPLNRARGRRNFIQ